MIDISYFAGYLDGEGCFSHNRTSPRVYVSNTHRPTLDKFQKQFGGTVRKHTDASARARELHEWYVHGPTAIDLCIDLLPHLREKQPQAAVLIALYREKRPAARDILQTTLKKLKRI